MRASLEATHQRPSACFKISAQCCFSSNLCNTQRASNPRCTLGCLPEDPARAHDDTSAASLPLAEELVDIWYVLLYFALEFARRLGKVKTLANSDTAAGFSCEGRRESGALCHLNSGEATTILASWGSRGYSAMMLPTCRRGAAAREHIQQRLGMSLGDSDGENRSHRAAS